MLSECMALYEDQVGLFDWRQQYVGNSKEVYFEQTSHSSTTSKRVFLSTESNVLAALNARTGQIVWRQVFERKDNIINTLLHNSNLLITLSGNGRVVRSWDPNKGHLLWESTSSNYVDYQNERYGNLENMLKNHQAVLLDDDGGLLVSTNKGVKLISQSDGSEIWDYQVKDTGVHLFGVTKVNNRAIAFGVKEKSDLIFVNFIHLDIESGKVLSDVVIAAPWILQNDITCTLLSSKFFMCLNPAIFSVIVKNFADESKTVFVSMPLALLNVDRTEIFDKSFISSMSRSCEYNEFYIHINDNNNILAHINPDDSQISLINYLHKPGFFSLTYLSNKKYIIEISRASDLKSKQENLQILFFDSENLKSPIKSLETNMPYDKQFYQGSPSACSVFMYSKKNDISYRILLITEDHSISLIQNIDGKDGKTLWTRNEALSRVSSVKMVELPPSTSASKLELLHAEFAVVPNSSILTMFINRVKSQIRQLQAFTDSLRKRQRNLDPNSDYADDESTTVLKRDQFNIIKMMLLMTEGRKMFALNSQNGNVVWSSFMSGIKKGAKSEVTVFEQRTTAHFPLPPQCVLVAPYNEHLVRKQNLQPNEYTALYSFNPLTGEGLAKPDVIQQYRVLQIAELPFLDEKFLKVIGIVDTNYHFHIYPETPDTLAKLKLHLNSIYIYIFNQRTHSFKGFKVNLVSSRFELYEVWSVNVPSDQVLLTMKTKRSDEVINSVGRVLGDHTVLYKYLNPNLVAFMTMQGDGVKRSIFVYIVDAVTGHVLYHARHKGVDTPVDLILSEHWLVYLYYNTKGRRIEISVAEFYEGYEEKNHTAFSSLDPVDTPMVLSQGYLLPVSGVRAITSTATERGITNKNILLGLDNGFVYSIPKNFLDPRRSFKPTQMLQEEGVPPYMPELPVMQQGYINYNQTVANIRGIHTSPAGLESTSLVLVYGLDLFYTRVTPSKMFDVLKEDFDYIFISGVLSALILASIICSKLASMRALKMAWG